MILFESDLNYLYATGIALAVGLPLRYLAMRGMNRLLGKLFPPKA